MCGEIYALPSAFRNAKGRGRKSRESGFPSAVGRRKNGGEGGIRTLDALFGAYTLSRRARSTNSGTSPQSAARKPRDDRHREWLDLVPEKGLEPLRPRGRQILSLVRLPFRHSGTR